MALGQSGVEARLPFDRHYGNGLALGLALDTENGRRVAVRPPLRQRSVAHTLRLIGIVMEERYHMLLIAIGSTLLVLGTTALIGLVVAWRLDKKNERDGSDDTPGPPRQHL